MREFEKNQLDGIVSKLSAAKVSSLIKDEYSKWQQASTEKERNSARSKIIYLTGVLDQMPDYTTDLESPDFFAGIDDLAEDEDNFRRHM